MSDARKVMLLVTAPGNLITLTNLEEIAAFLQDESPKSVIRIGDYPRRAREISTTLIVSKLTRVDRIEKLYGQAEDLFKKQADIYQEAEDKIRQMQEVAKNLPTLD
jgi:cell division GTPase FtsZ